MRMRATLAGVLGVLGLSLVSLVSGGCGKAKPGDAPDSAPAPPIIDAAPDVGALDAAPEGGKGSQKPMTQEEALLAATKQVYLATEEAKEKKPDCDKIADDLDVAFGIAAPKMGPDDRGAFMAFAACAKKKERWRLLEEIAHAMIAGDPTLKTSAYLPRALIGLGQYDTAARMASGILKAWPKDGEIYTTAALASSRLEDWETTSKQADQALLIQRQKGVSDEVTAQAHVFKAEALLHQGKIDEANRELDAAKRVKVYEFATKMREKSDIVKNTGLLLDADVEDEVYLGLLHLYPKAPAPLGGLATFKLYEIGDKASQQVRIELTLSSICDPVGKAVTVNKGRREIQKLFPPTKADWKPESVKAPQPAQLGYKITSAVDGTVLYEETRKVTIEPKDRLPLYLRAHDTDYRPVRELAAAWITPSAKAVIGLLEAAKKRAPNGAFAGGQGPTFPQVQAIWDELRSRGVSFVRDSSVDSEGARSQKVRLPAEVIGAQSGNALEGSLVFATLLEAIGLDVILVNVPGNMFVGWMPTKADHGTPDALKSAVSSPVGTAFFLETTMIGEGPADAAILRGDAELVERVGAGDFSNGSAGALLLSKLRKAGILPQPSD